MKFFKSLWNTRIYFLFISTMILAGCSSKVNVDRPVTVRGMILEFLEFKKAAKKNLELDIYKRHSQLDKVEYYLRAEVFNDTNEAICIPSVFYDGRDLIAFSEIITGTVDKTREIKRRTFPPQLIWPVTEYVLLAPQSSFGLTINLSNFFEIQNVESSLFIRYSFPAFKCEFFQRGYPISQSKVKSQFEFTGGLPVHPVNENEVIIFSGNTEFKIQSE